MATTDAIRLVLGDQLSRSVAALRDLQPERDVVLLAEVIGEATYVRHHPKKIAFLFSAMRHFAARLRGEGLRVDYVALDHPDSTGSLRGEAARAVSRHQARRLVVTEPGEHRLAVDMAGWTAAMGVPVAICEDDRFLCSRSAFADWANGRKTLRMEHFYRAMRQRHGVLLDGDGRPEGGRWNYDADNRKALPAEIEPPDPPRFAADATTTAVLQLVTERFADHFGDLDGFWFGVTADQAERALTHFIDHALPRFGDYQDAMRQDRAVLYHSALSLYMNAGLLDPLTVIRRAEKAYRDGGAALNAAEGFIRQILGWREYVRGIYWLTMPGYAETNFFGADRPLPAFYWTGDTALNCLAQAIGQTKREAYAHHIQRLMVTGTFALLTGIDPKQVSEWYLIAYADAYEWVELPNVHGMALFADGGLLASKPYAASGAYINRMSDYCRHCAYDVAQKTGDRACPFNYLYWTFLMAHEDKLRGNPRLGMAYKTLDRMDAMRRRTIRNDSARFLDAIGIAGPDRTRKRA